MAAVAIRVNSIELAFREIDSREKRSIVNLAESIELFRWLRNQAGRNY